MDRSLESVLEARVVFTMIELGAGYGPWLVNAAAAARQRRKGLRIKLPGVEAEPTHFAWLTQHNGLDPAEHVLMELAIHAQEGVVSFYVGKPDGWYGQGIADQGDTARQMHQVRAVTLGRILADLESVDLIDLDIEGHEHVVLSSAIEEMDRKVRRVHIRTHARSIERGLRELFREHSWYKRNDYEVGSTELTRWGPISFNNGVQTWINPRLEAVEPNPAELDWLQWTMHSSEVRYGRLQDEMHELRDPSNRVELESRLHTALAATKERMTVRCAL